ncbi:MAG: hypothetical protein Q7S28_02070 [bacterium]|nr:hypothetical protein [bacterium]
MKGFRLFALILGAILVMTAIATTCNGQTLDNEDNFSLGNPFERHASYQLRGVNLIPKTFPVIRIEPPTFASMANYYKTVTANAPAKQSYATRTRVYGSAAANCRAVLPYHDAPRDADSILARCNAGFANIIVDGLRILSDINNSRH